MIGKISLGCTVGLSAVLGTMLLSGNSNLGAGLKVRSLNNRVSKPLQRMTLVNAARRGGKKPQQQDLSADPLWLPNTERPEWLDGSLPGDRGFDPLGLSKPAEYLQYELDQLDQNQAVNKAGKVIGRLEIDTDQVSDTDTLSPYADIFGLKRFRECELIHGRWAMLATLGAVVAELSTGVPWDQAGKVALDGASYLGNQIPLSISQLTILEVLLVGGAEIYRNTERDLDRRLYPGGAFDPLGFSQNPEKFRTLQEQEIKHARLAMVAAFGCGVQAFTTGEGLIDNLNFLN